MLIQCKSCNVSFDEEYGQCLACGEPIRFSKQELLEHSIRQARKWLQTGLSANDIHHQLRLTNSLNDLEIKNIIRAAKSRRRNASRKHGSHLLRSGLFMIGVSLILSLRWIFCLAGTALGVMMVMAGSFVAFTGLGHDDW